MVPFHTSKLNLELTRGTRGDDIAARWVYFRNKKQIDQTIHLISRKKGKIYTIILGGFHIC